MMDLPVFLLRIDKLDARPRRQQEPIGRLGHVAAMMKPVRFDVRRKLLFDFPGMQVTTRIHARVAAAGGWSRPDKSADDQQVFRRLITAAGVGSGPKQLAGRRIKGPHRSVAAGEQQNIVHHHDARSELE